MTVLATPAVLSPPAVRIAAFFLARRRFQVGGDAPGDPYLPCPLILGRYLGWTQDSSERSVAGTGEQIGP